MAESAESPLEPGRIARFGPEEPLEGGWRVVRYVPGRVLTVEQPRSEQLRALWRMVLVLLVPLVLAVALVAGTQGAPGDLRLVTYPVVALFLLVFGAGLLSLRRALRRVREGVRLELDAGRGRVTGFPEASPELSRALADLGARMTERPLSEVTEIRLSVARGAAGERHRPRALAAIEVLAGPGLQGPFATSEEPRWELARDQLLPLACELGRIARRPVVIAQRGTSERFTLSLERIDALPAGGSYELLPTK